MDKPSHNNNPSFKRRARFFFYRWHRRLGLTILLFVLLLSSTGIILNHPSTFGIDRSYPQSIWLLQPYKNSLVDKANGFLVNHQWIYQQFNQLFIDEQSIGTCQQLVGVARHSDGLLIACETQWFLIDDNAQLLDTYMPSDFSIKGEYQLANLQDGSLMVGTAKATTAHQSKSWMLLDLDSYLLTDMTQDQMQLAVTAYNWHVLPSELTKTNQNITWQRILLDLHSGRWFGYWLGNAAVWVIDLAALILMLLSLSGFWIWWSKR